MRMYVKLLELTVRIKMPVKDWNSKTNQEMADINQAIHDIITNLEPKETIEQQLRECSIEAKVESWIKMN